MPSMSRALDVAVVTGQSCNDRVHHRLRQVIAPLQIEGTSLNMGDRSSADAYWDIIEVDDFEDWNENYRSRTAHKKTKKGFPKTM